MAMPLSSRHVWPSDISKSGACSPRYAYAIRFTLASMALVFFLVGGASSAWTEELTLGLVQSQIRNGMTQGEVAQAIGSPNIASKDRDGNEVWIYDKISTETKTESEEFFANLRKAVFLRKENI